MAGTTVPDDRSGDTGGEGRYPEFDELLERARRTAPRFPGPGDVAGYEALIRRRGYDWCTAVLDRTFTGLRSVTGVEAYALVLADVDDLDPPLPAHVQRQRAAAQQRQAELELRHAARDAADQARWDDALAVVGSVVAAALEVRANAGGRRTGTGLASGPLRHAVALTDLVSQVRGRPRVHPAGRAVCETPGRARPRTLAPAGTESATCASCLKLVPRLRMP